MEAPNRLTFNKTRAVAFFKKALKRLLLFNGILLSFFVFLSFTDLPYYAYYWLGTSSPKLEKEPDVIVLLGGSGMPSPDGFMRCYFAAKEANRYKNAAIVIALPANGDGSTSQLDLMAHELVLHGVDSSRISYESEGFNTHSQAEHIVSKYNFKKTTVSVLLVSSAEHLYRAIRTFKAAGFANVGGEATFENPVNESKAKDNENTTDTRVKSLSLRYNMWSYLNYELLVLREYSAIAYYWIKGWI